MQTPTGRSRLQYLVAGLLILYPVGLLGLSLIHWLLPRRAGMLALTEVFAPYLFLPLLVTGVLAARWRAWRLGALLAVCLGVFLARVPVGLGTAAPPPPGAVQVTAMAWNTYVGGTPRAILPVLRTKPADLVALEEITAEPIQADLAVGAQYPYQVVYPGDPIAGMLLLSVYPVREQGVLGRPGHAGYARALWAQVDLGGGASLLVVVGHPTTPHYLAGCRIAPFCYDPADRDAQLAAIRAFVEPALRRSEPVLILGDFNVTDREPGYCDLAAGLQDAQQWAGRGLGHTWGPLKGPTFVPLLRIDYLLTGPNLTPLAAAVDCTWRSSDHCILHGRFALVP